ncbi:hypothetical protein ACWGIN_28000 [Streptomyces sp. NPDC054861]
MEAAQSRHQAVPGARTAFARFVLCGGGVGIGSSFAVTALAGFIPFILANALITVASTLLATELHARFTFGAHFTFGTGLRATGRQHAQSAGSAAAAYVVTCTAMFLLQHLVAAPGATLEQTVYLTASALAGAARFVVLRLVVFPHHRPRPATPTTTTAPGPPHPPPPPPLPPPQPAPCTPPSPVPLPRPAPRPSAERPDPAPTDTHPAPLGTSCPGARLDRGKRQLPTPACA